MLRNITSRSCLLFTCSAIFEASVRTSGTRSWWQEFFTRFKAPHPRSSSTFRARNTRSSASTIQPLFRRFAAENRATMCFFKARVCITYCSNVWRAIVSSRKNFNWKITWPYERVLHTNLRMEYFSAAVWNLSKRRESFSWETHAIVVSLV